jgi:site-specific DNA-methyltransferase (adenine-specific)
MIGLSLDPREFGTLLPEEETTMVERGSLVSSAAGLPPQRFSQTAPAVAPDQTTRERLDLAGLNVALRTDLGALVIGDCLEVLGHLPDDSLDLVVTSPPYDRQPKYGNGEKYGDDWYHGFFLQVTAEILRVLKPHGSFLLNYRSKRTADGERGTLQYELVFLLRDQGFRFAEDFIWGKPSPPPGRFNRYLKDAVEYCFQFTKTDSWQFFPEHCLTPARWDRKDVERRKKLAHNFVRADTPSGQGRKRVQAGPDLVRPSTLLYLEPEFKPNPTRHPARFPIELPTFFINLLSLPGQVVFDPFVGTGTTAVAAEQLGRQWLASEIDGTYTEALPDRLRRVS